MATSKREAFDALKTHFVDGPSHAAKAAVRTAAHAVFSRARAEFDDVEKEELLEACAALGLAGGAGSKRDAFALLEAAFVRRAHCVAKLAHKNAGNVTALAFVEGAGLVSGGDHSICVWAEGADRGLSSDWAPGGATEIAPLPGGRFATASYATHAVEVWDAGAGRRLHDLRGHTEHALCVAALPGGLLASGSDDKTVRIWNAGTGAHVATLEGHEKGVNALAALPDGRLASGGDTVHGGIIRLWNVAARACTQMLRPVSEVHALAALDGGRLASGCANNGIHIWSLASGIREALLSLEGQRSFCLAALPNGLLASGGGNTVHVWDVAARACVAVLAGHEGGDRGNVLALAALPDGRLASGSYYDRLVRVWALAAPGSPEDAAAAAAAAGCATVAAAPGGGP